MSQHDMNIANGPGATFRADLNNALGALVSQSSGASAPSPTFPCQVWADTGTGRLKQRDSANTQWLDRGLLNDIGSSAGNYSGFLVIAVTTTLTNSNLGQAIYVGGSGAILTLPAVSSVSAGKSITFIPQQPCVIKGAGTDQIIGQDGSPSNTLQLYTGDQITLSADGASYWFRASYARRPGCLLGAPQVFSTPGTFTYTQTPGTNKVIVWVQGACAASGGAPATGAGVSSLGAPGGAGAYAESLITSAFAGVTVTVGLGGVGVSGAAGGNGGPSSFGALISCPGGIGGNTAGPSSSVFEVASNNTAAPSGGNLSSAIGLRGSLTLSLTPTALFLGSPALAKLGGLGGAATANTPSLAAKTGNNGDNGKVIVWEYS